MVFVYIFSKRKATCSMGTSQQVRGVGMADGKEAE